MRILMSLLNFFIISKREKRIIERMTRKDAQSTKRVVGRGTLIMDAKEARHSKASKKLINHISKNKLVS